MDLRTVYGKMLGWECKVSLVDQVVDYEQVKNAAEDAGLSVRAIPKPTQHRAMVRAAKDTCKTLVNGEQDRHGRFHDSIARPILSNSNRTVYGLFEEEHDEADETNRYEGDTKITLDKQSKQVRAEGQRAEQFERIYSRYANGLTSDDIRRYIYTSLRGEGAITLLHNGGLYFVPSSREGIINNIETFLTTLGIGILHKSAKVELEGQSDAAQWIWEAAQKELLDRVQYSVKLAQTAKKRGLEKRAEQVEADKVLLETYAELTGCEAELQGALKLVTDAETEITKRMAAIRAQEAI